MELQDKLKTYTVKQVSEILTISKTEVQNLEKDGDLLPIDFSDSINKKSRNRRRRFVRYSHQTIIDFLKLKE